MLLSTVEFSFTGGRQTDDNGRLPAKIYPVRLAHLNTTWHSSAQLGTAWHLLAPVQGVEGGTGLSSSSAHHGNPTNSTNTS